GRLTIVGTGRDAWVVGRPGRLQTVCARVARQALLRGRSTSPLGAWTGTGFEPQTQTGHARGLARRDQGRHLYRQRSMARFSQEKRVESPAPAVHFSAVARALGWRGGSGVVGSRCFALRTRGVPELFLDEGCRPRDDCGSSPSGLPADTPHPKITRGH